jgi:hypothetical protein
MRCWWWLGQASGDASEKLRFRFKNRKLSRRGSICGVPLKTALEGDGGPSLDVGDEVVVVVWARTRLCQGGWSVRPTKPKTNHFGLGLGLWPEVLT